MDSKGKSVYLIEGKDGMLFRVPSDRLAAFREAQKHLDRPLNKSEQRLRDKIVQRFFG